MLPQIIRGAGVAFGEPGATPRFLSVKFTREGEGASMDGVSEATARAIEWAVIGATVFGASAGIDTTALKYTALAIPIAKRAVEFKRERGRLPSVSSADAWEKHLAEGAAAFVRFKDEGRYE